MSDWEDDDSTSKVAKPLNSSTFGTGVGRGCRPVNVFGSNGTSQPESFGRGSGFGLSTAPANGFCESKSAGEFGSSAGGFGLGRNSNGNDWNEEESAGPKYVPTTSFGVGRGGRGGGGSRACFKCGDEGHMSRECPSGGSGSRACFKCGDEGHMSRECPSGGSGGGGSRACFKCGEEGHMSRECPSGGSGGGGGSRACFKCGEEGHMSRECPSGGGGGGGSRACFKCGEEGHMSRECPSGGGGSRACHKCYQEGHMAKDCPAAGSSGDAPKYGMGRGGFGSGARTFGQADSHHNGMSSKFAEGGGGEKTASGSGCRKCGEDGHFANDCPEAAGEPGRPKVESYIPPEITEDEASYNIGINFDKYDSIPVELSGRDPTRPISSFEEAGLLETFRHNVVKANYTRPTPVQKYAIPAILSGRDLMACAQTGSGKTAAFLLPVLTGILSNGLVCTGSAMSPLQEPAALVIAPTRELADQIFKEARKFSSGTVVRAVVAYGGVTPAYQAGEIRKGTNLLVATPGRLIDFVTRGVVGLSKVRYLILDEADRMLDMGFEPDVRRIVEQLGVPSKTDRQTLMFSATFPEEIQRLAADFLNDYLFLTVGRVGGANEDVTQSVVQVSQQEKRDKLVELLTGTEAQLTLVFVELKRNADFLASYLSQSGYRTTSIHGDRLQREREEALADFKRGRAPVLVATSVAARGLDIPKVSHVVNYDMPTSIDEYVHRIGRTGRCGNLGRATSFFDPSCDSDIARALVKILQEAHQEVPEFLEDAAQGNLGRFSTSRGNFNSRDARAPGQGGRGTYVRSNQESHFDSGRGGHAAPATVGNFGESTAADDESWD